MLQIRWERAPYRPDLKPRLLAPMVQTQPRTNPCHRAGHKGFRVNQELHARAAPKVADPR